MDVWIDIKNSHEPLFFKSIINSLKNNNFYISCREFAEITSLLENYEMDHEIIGHRPEGSLFHRRVGFVERLLKLLVRVPKYDVSLNHWSIWSMCDSWLRGKPSIVFNDNDINPINFSSFFTRMIRYLITPKFIDKKYYIKQGLNDSQIFQYNGFKEDIYVSDYVPDKHFCSNIPFEDFVTIRAENTQALYYGKNKNSIVPDLVRKFNSEGIGVVFLPRYKSDKYLVEGFSGVHIPASGLNGLDLCYYSRAILTGAGTFSREAGVMGRCAVSFFGGEKFLSVDKEMISRKWLFHSRDPDKIITHVKSHDSKTMNLDRSKSVKNEVLGIINTILNEKID